MARILITGSTGYLGKRVVQLLIEQAADIELLCLCRNISKAKDQLPYSQCRFAEIQETETILNFQPDVILHLAAYSTSSHERKDINPLIESNIKYGIWLLDTLRQMPCHNLTFVNTGSFAEYRLGKEEGLRPAYLYTATKAAFRQFLNFYQDLMGFRLITAIPYSVYGGNTTRKQLMDYMLESMEAPEAVKMSPGEQILDFVHADDVAQFFVNCALHPNDIAEGEYHLGTGKGTSVRALADLISQLSGKTLNIEWGGLNYRPLDVMRAIAPKDKKLQPFWQPKIDLQNGIRTLLQEKR